MSNGMTVSGIGLDPKAQARQPRIPLGCGLGVVAVAVILFSAHLSGPPVIGTQAATAQPSASACWNSSADFPLAGATCGPMQALQLGCYLPPDIVTVTNLNTMQRSADIFSWQKFMALDWPALAGERGVPDASKTIAAPGVRVWETWKEEYETQKIDDVVDHSVQAAAATGTLPATLTDQHGKLVRYEIRMNKVMFDYIVNGGNNLENLKTPDDTWKVRLIEEDFHRLMFEAEGV